MCVCVCVGTHPTTTICCRESQTVRPLKPAGPTQQTALFPGLSQGSVICSVETARPPPPRPVCCGGCNSNTDTISFFFLLLTLPSPAPA